MMRAVGSDRMSSLLLYEIANTFFANLPGAAGIVLRQKLYRLLLGQLGKGATLLRGVTVRCPGRLFVGDGTLIDEGVFFDIKSADAAVRIGRQCQIMRGAHFETGYSGHVTLGENSFVGAYAILNGQGGLEIGNNVLIAGHCFIVSGNHGFDDTSRPMNEQDFVSLGVVIEDDVWLGGGAKVMDGVRIGRGSIVAAGAVVTRDVEPYSIMAGVPARLVRKRA